MRGMRLEHSANLISVHALFRGAGLWKTEISEGKVFSQASISRHKDQKALKVCWVGMCIKVF